jgi:hydrogenase expression/formation protein HypE
MSHKLPIGKLPRALLEQLLARYTIPHPNVVVGPGVGRDAAVIDIGDRYLVVTADPVTFASARQGRYLVKVNANDVACMGAKPTLLTAVILLPAGNATGEMAESIMADIAEECSHLDIALCGGHTEITPTVDQPVLVGCLIGEVEHDRLVTPTSARPGDHILLTKAIAIEGTALIAQEREAELRGTYGDEYVQRCLALLEVPGIGVVEEALKVAEHASPSAMHDPTEGGLATALWELADASSVGMEVSRDAIPILPETRTLCQHFALDPLGLIASGALLVTAPEEEIERIQRVLQGSSIPSSVIGRVTDRASGMVLVSGETVTEIPRFDADEITRVSHVL